MEEDFNSFLNTYKQMKIANVSTAVGSLNLDDGSSINAKFNSQLNHKYQVALAVNLEADDFQTFKATTTKVCKDMAKEHSTTIENIAILSLTETA